MRFHAQDKFDNAEDKSGVVLGGALTSGGLLGAGLTVLALKLQPEYHPYVMPIIPTVSSACSVAVRWVGTRIQRKFSTALWEQDKASVVEIAVQGIAEAEKELELTKAKEAKGILQAGINRYERIKALALTAAPGERPWMKELKLLGEKK
jgi:hypothetical protein